MCLIFLSLNNHPTYKLVIAANRDEFHHRKTAAADFWSDYPDILGGRDLEAQGTWMAMTRSGKISLLTNYRDPANINPQAPSRGRLVSDYLQKEMYPEHYLNEVAKNGPAYNGFNLLAGAVDDLWYFSNYQGTVKKLSPGLHGLSNHLLNTPWPKVERGKRKLQPILQKLVVRPDELFEFLYDDQQAPDDQLPETGIGLVRERALSSMFIKTPNYGSRCSTVILVDKQNNALFSERVYNLTTFEHATRTFQFSIPA
jgi:uncharacterized protein with NRDE domain